ncbi:MAG: SurA N-terminal domain-containing protein [Cyclobacteriaceae bacterium]|nr:SurA N-terminal domain-containing protein [Cyclobacteriaceae bacterium]
MALIGSLRNKMGTWVVVFVFVAIAAFILGDLLSGQSAIFNLNSNDVGEIGGHTVSLEEFQNAVKEREANYILNFNREPGEREMTTLRQQAWELLILKYAIEPQYQKVGLEVTSDEIWDMIQGKNVDENVKMAFTNQQTGLFERDRVVQYLNQVKTMPENSEPRVRWELFQRDLLPGRKRIKFENLLVKTNYTTTAEAEREYHLQSDVAEVKFLYVPFYAMSDSSSKVTDSDLKDYYNKNKEKYKTEETRSLSYIGIPVIPSAQDTLDIRKELERVVADFATSDDDSLYAAGVTEGQTPYARYTIGSLPGFIRIDQLVQGKVIGPFIDGNTFKVVKVSKVFQDTVYNAKASHILIKWTDTSDASKKEAKEKARKILNEIKGGADFGLKAREHGTDGTASRGGDLGWFSSGQMVKPFESAVFGATRTGVLNDVVETDFGYHIIDVTELKNNTAYELAIVENAITPSDATTNEAYRKAEMFAADISGFEDFKERAKKEQYNVLDAKNIGSSDRRIGTLGEAREIVKWLFNEASKGKVSTIFDLQDIYVVAIMTDGLEKGYKPFDLVKDEIMPLVRNQVKGKAIIQKLGESKGTLEEMAIAFGTDANIYSSSDLKLSSNTLPTAGFDPQAVGIAFSLEDGKRSKPFVGENGVIVMELQNKTIAPAVADYTAYKTQLEQGAQSRSSFSIAEAIKDNSGIENLLYKFY